MAKDKPAPKKVVVTIKESETASATIAAEMPKGTKDCISCVGGLYIINTETGEQVICKYCKGTTKI